MRGRAWFSSRSRFREQDDFRLLHSGCGFRVAVLGGEAAGAVKVQIRDQVLDIEDVDRSGPLAAKEGVAHMFADHSPVLAFQQCLYLQQWL